MSLSTAQKTLLRSKNQYSIPGLAILQPATIFACQINDTFGTHDMVLEFEYDNVTAGAYGDVIPGQTAFIGSAAGLHDVGICRVRKALGATTFYVGETSEVDFANDLFVTVVDAFDIWPRHPLIIDEEVFMDGDVDYSDQHTNFDPVPIMGGHVVLDVSSYPAAVTFPDVANCYVYGSSISSRSFTASAGVVTNGTSTNPTLTISSYPTNGYIRVKLTVTAANGKSFSGYRYVLVFDSDNRPITDFVLDSCGANVSDGGWSSRVILNDQDDIDLLRERGLAILFSKDYFDGAEDVVGLQTGRENIWMAGWIFQHLDVDDPEFSPNTFDIYSANYWLSREAMFPVGVEIATSAPAAWTEIGALTIDRGLWHLFHWRSTATIVMDVYLTGDTKYTSECSSPNQDLWSQILEIAGSQILAEPRCDYNNRIFVKVPYNLIPAASRAASSTLVMALTTADYTKTTEVQWTAPQVAQINLSGVKVTLAGNGTARFSLSPGHTPAYLGNVEILDRLLLSSQSQSNSLAGLVFSHKNNPYPDIPLTLHGSNRAFDIAPVQYATIALDEFTGSILPTSIDYSHDHETGKTEIQVGFEAVTTEGLSIDGDIPLGNGDVFQPPRLPPLPPIPPLPPVGPVIPGDVGDVDNGPSTVVMATSNKGVVYTTNFDSSSPEWLLMNDGLEEAGLENYVRKIVVCPSGAMFAAVGSQYIGGANWEIWWTEGVGGIWELLFDTYNVCALGVNPLQNEQIAFLSAVASGDIRINIGDRDTITEGSGCSGRNRSGDLNYIEDRWIGTLADNDLFTSMFIARWDSDGALQYQETKPNNVGGTNATYGTIISGEDEVALFMSHNGLGFYSDLLGTITGAFDGSDAFGNGGRWDALASDPTGQYMMGCKAGVITKYSSDNGRTFAAVTNLNVGYTGVTNCGDESTWIVCTVQDVRYSLDAGANWANKSGNLSTIAPLCAPQFLKFVSW